MKKMLPPQVNKGRKCRFILINSKPIMVDPIRIQDQIERAVISPEEIRNGWNK